MKANTHIITLLAACIILALNACKKDKDKDPDTQNPPVTSPYKCSTCVQSAEAKAEYDGSSKGIYKGILVASTGTIRFSVGNDDSSITATMVIDGTTVLLSSGITWQQGAPYIAPFTGKLNGSDVSITFSVKADGSDVRVLSSSIPGHPNPVFTLVKETSNTLIEGFEGTYSIDDSRKGTLNILLSRTMKKWGGVARENGTTDDDSINGTLNDNKIIDDKGKTLGTLSNDEINGSFQDSKGKTVNFSGKRTL